MVTRLLRIAPLVLLAVHAPLLPAQTTAPGAATPDEFPAPTAPFVAQPPSPGSWTVEYRASAKDKSSAEGEPATAPRLTKISTRSSGTFEERIATFADGTTQTIYRSGNQVLAQTTPDSPFLFLLLRSGNGSDPLFQPGFYGTQGVKLDTYAGPEKLGGRDCYVYELSPAIAGSDDDDDVIVAARQAYVDVQTRLPVALKIGKAQYTFQISSANPGPIKLPEAALKVWREEKRANEIAFGKKNVKPGPFDQ